MISEEKQKALEAALGNIEKQFGKGSVMKLGNVELTGMVLACVVAMALSLVFYILDKLKLTNDQ